MSIRLQIIIAVVIVLALVHIVNLIRKGRLELKYALVWFFVGILMLLLDLIPGILGWLSGLLGITLPINTLFTFGFAFVLLIIFTQTIVITNLTRSVKRLTQEVGLVNKRLEDALTNPKNVQENNGMPDASIQEDRHA